VLYAGSAKQRRSAGIPSAPGDAALAAAKAGVRDLVKARLASLTLKGFSAAGERARRSFVREIAGKPFRSVLVFISRADEIDTLPLMESALNAGKSLFTPRTEGIGLVFYRLFPRIPGGGSLPVNRGILEERLGTLKRGPGGIREPEMDSAAALGAEDFPLVIFTPGLAFDREGRRLGRGRGYYDRFFAALEGRFPGGGFRALGLCMGCQVVERAPAGPGDKTMDGVWSEGLPCYGQVLS
jgi:5-formyltetrahydrofolate cyclo-ligase